VELDRSLGGFFRADHLKDRDLSLDHLFGDNKVLDLLLGRQHVHRFKQDLFEYHHQAASTDLSFMGLVSNGAQGSVGEFESDVIELEFTLILFYERVLWLSKYSYQCIFVELCKRPDNWQPTDEFGNQTVMDQIFGFETF
jgi:hypothetical protein